MVTYTKASFETEDLTEMYLKKTYMGRNANSVKEDILNKYKGKGVDFVMIIEKLHRNNYYKVGGLVWNQKDVDIDMKRSFPKLVRLYADINDIVTNILYR